MSAAASWLFNAPSTCDQLEATFGDFLIWTGYHCIFQPHVHELRWQPHRYASGLCRTSADSGGAGARMTPSFQLFR